MVAVWAALIAACGGSAFSGGGVDAAADGTVRSSDGGRGDDGLETGVEDAAGDAPGETSDAEPSDADAKDAGRDAASHDAGNAKDAAVPDAGDCSGTGECDATHPCSSSGGPATRCCSPLPGVGPTVRCGFCSAGVCPG
jgi:hypothetical protein